MLRYKLGMKGFDYDRMEQDLNDLGRKGWEAVGTLAPSFGSGQAIEVALILKKRND
ncbi:DUF4177 domain-containing protein [Nocardia carnea]|uniref:DUF4177 domain-containing protein n=1 Tax=Nocardia carnea TaxID=37328 RepID=A0ABW7THR4_9NOCA|nr:DUF4177 domain-containing protein [Nocardia carnea]